ncbi:type IV secretory system conjugative DNA transfer family protein [Tsukamurella tyrosinosolvens]|uniref:type IV secretory system conjugative DNA transfer family protein n=1 Tax=Tsukamurella tyrosinosolvens TaxID=57704 RepID=UPI001CE07DEC|nr:hypothetical protein [Tsukamurella tyrosinosolvens]MCA4996800.1 type IV secretory system conjugative DNA transfer family protein [Tsukamurella tyrosinosolvens]
MSKTHHAGAPWVFSRLYLPRPLTVEQVDGVLLRLAADRAAPPLVLEVRARSGQPIEHLVGTPAEHVTWVQRSFRRLLPGLELDGIAADERGIVDRSVRLRLRPHGLALATDRAELTSRSILAAMDTHLNTDEVLALQIVLGPRRAPRHLPPRTPDPGRVWWHALTRGQEPAPGPVRSQIDARSGQHGFAAIIRIGVAASTPERREQLVIGVLGALSTAVDRGTYVDLTFETPGRFNRPTLPWRWPLRLGVTELTGLLAWPLGEQELPGIAPMHPRPLRVPVTVNRTERLFAVSAVPGSTEPVGIASADITGHVLSAGPTGVGKSTVLLNLICADIAAGRPVLVLDPKRQLIDDIVERAITEARMDDVVLIDPAMVRSGRVVGFNPLDVGDRDPDVVADGLVAVLKATFHDGWGPRTEDIIHAGLLTLARIGSTRSTPFTLLDLPRLLSDEGFRRPIVGAVLNDPGLGSFWSSYLAMTPAAQAQMIAAPMNKLRQYLLRPSLRAILGQSSPAFRLRDVFRDNKVVLVPLNDALIGPLTAQLLGSLVVAETWSATMERASEANPTDRPATVVIDEMHQFLHLPVSIEDALSRSRSYGVGWHLAHQHRGQLPPSTRAAVDSNAKSKIIFQPLDPDDAVALAKQAPDLKPIDFLSLPQHHAYVNLTTRGRPAGWALVKTSPAPPPTGLGDRIRKRSDELYAAPIPTVPMTTAPPSSPDAADAATAPPGQDEPVIGRKKRRQP